MSRPEPYNEYPCPECEEEVRVELPAGTHVTCDGCGTLLSIDADAEFDRGMWHDRTTLSVVPESPVDADAAEAFDQLEDRELESC
jgi:hypothetical protein